VVPTQRAQGVEAALRGVSAAAVLGVALRAGHDDAGADQLPPATVLEATYEVLTVKGEKS
jgi:hypothetical protein